MRRDRIGKLDCLINDDENAKTCIFLFHGYGASAEDLAPLSEVINLDKPVTWVFPNGILDVPIGPGFMGKAWFQIDVEALNAAMLSGKPRDMSDKHPKGIDRASELAREAISVMADQYDNVIIGGFSQGAMLTSEVVYSGKFRPKGLVNLSGTLLDKDNWKRGMNELKGLPLFISHGNFDEVLGVKFAEQYSQMAKESGLDTEFHSFKGGHEIPPHIISELTSFYRRLV